MAILGVFRDLVYVVFQYILRSGGSDFHVISGLFVASFFASMFDRFLSDLGVILGGFGEPKSIIFGVEML